MESVSWKESAGRRGCGRSTESLPAGVGYSIPVGGECKLPTRVAWRDGVGAKSRCLGVTALV
jgi:hypothetical protein